MLKKLPTVMTIICGFMFAFLFITCSHYHQKQSHFRNPAIPRDTDFLQLISNPDNPITEIDFNLVDLDEKENDTFLVMDVKIKTLKGWEKSNFGIYGLEFDVESIRDDRDRCYFVGSGSSGTFRTRGEIQVDRFEEAIRPTHFLRDAKELFVCGSVANDEAVISKSVFIYPEEYQIKQEWRLGVLLDFPLTKVFVDSIKICPVLESEGVVEAYYIAVSIKKWIKEKSVELEHLWLGNQSSKRYEYDRQKIDSLFIGNSDVIRGGFFSAVDDSTHEPLEQIELEFSANYELYVCDYLNVK